MKRNRINSADSKRTRRGSKDRLPGEGKTLDSGAADPKGNADTQRRFQELQVYSLEMELQNEELCRATARLEKQIREHTEMNRKLVTALTLAEEREKTRLAKVLHDHLQQLLVAARFLLQEVDEAPRQLQRKTVRKVQKILTESAEVARTLSVELSPPILHEKGLAAALEWLGGWMHERHGLVVKVTSGPNQVRLSEGWSSLLFQALRELLFNVVKHAQVKTASVAICWKNSHVNIVVSDEGKGFNPARLQPVTPSSGQLGLFTVRDRLSLLGGRMEIDSAPGRGSRFTLQAPLCTPDSPPLPEACGERSRRLSGKGCRKRF